MNGRSYLAGAVVGLAGLLGGCEEDKTWIRDQCQNGDLSLTVEYHQRGGDTNYCVLRLSRAEGKVIAEWGRLFSSSSVRAYCDDGSVLDAETCSFIRK